MASLGNTFNPDEVPEDEFEPVAAGDYLVQVVDSEIAPTKTGSGQMLKLTFEILEGELQGRRVWERLNIVNANADAQRISQQQLKKLCDALGTGAISDSEELHFQPVMATVAIRPAKGEYGPSNVIRKYSAYGAQPQTQTTAAKPPAQKAPPATTTSVGGRPWQRKS